MARCFRELCVWSVTRLRFFGGELEEVFGRLAHEVFEGDSSTSYNTGIHGVDGTATRLWTGIQPEDVSFVNASFVNNTSSALWCDFSKSIP